MDTNISAEELATKARKPYIITNQRERWTEEEHNKFLEALRLYGRAWQRIEEHIGTKTAVQIRSHAQKFFSKLEKEAQAKGIRVGQALDIEIPPPRPKRKPSTPYPRKTGNCTSTSQITASKYPKHVPSVSSAHCIQALDLEREPLAEKPNGDEKPSRAKENQDDNFSGIFTHLTEAHCSSISSVNKNSTMTKVALKNSCTFREFLPSLTKEIPDNGASKASNADNSCILDDKAVQYMSLMNKDRDVNGTLPTDDTQGTQNYPRHVPVHVLNRSTRACVQVHSDIPSQDFMFRLARDEVHQNNVSKPNHHAFPTFHPAFTPACHTQDDYRSFLQISSTFSNLIVSTLVQNPAAHAIASFGASFWPFAGVGSSNDSATCSSQPEGGFPSRQMCSPPSMAGIAAATVAAATAWWADQGLLPLCAPFTCPLMSATVVPPPETGKTHVAKTDRKEITDFENPQQLNPEKRSEALQAQALASKSPASSTDDSEEKGKTKLDVGLKNDDHKDEAVAVPDEGHDSDKTKNQNPVDRSSCGSNTPPRSDAENDASEKVEKDKEEPKETDENQPAVTESINCHCRSNNSNDSWKKVSEEGRLAFQALFSREALPQSFSPPPRDMNNNESNKHNTEKEKQNTDDNSRDASLLDLNSKTQDSSSNNQENKIKTLFLMKEHNDQEGLLTIGLGDGKNLKARRTGFKPYRRCSVEAVENRVVNMSSQTEERVSKRIRLEGEAST